MAASGKRLLESKDSIDDVMPYGICKFPKPIANIVTEYAWDTPLQKPFLFSDNDYTLQKILFLIEHAGPLDEFKSLVTRCIKKELMKKEEKNSLIDKSFTLDGMQGTPMQLLASRLDVTIRNEKGAEIDKGMAESFIDIVAELLPNRLNEVQKQAQIAAPLENVKAKVENESANLAALNHVFDAIKQNDEKITKLAIETFKEFIQDIKRRSMNDKGCLINNRYYVNLIHLIYGAFDILAKRGEELPPINAEDDSGHYGIKADRFCFEIIGASLQLPLPPRMRQLLRSGLIYLFNNNIKPERSIDVDGSIFRRGEIYDLLLGVNAYYDRRSLKGLQLARLGWMAVERCMRPFQNLLRTATPVLKIYATVSVPKEKTRRCLIM